MKVLKKYHSKLTNVNFYKLVLYRLCMLVVLTISGYFNKELLNDFFNSIVIVYSLSAIIVIAELIFFEQFIKTKNKLALILFLCVFLFNIIASMSYVTNITNQFRNEKLTGSNEYKQQQLKSAAQLKLINNISESIKNNKKIDNKEVNELALTDIRIVNQKELIKNEKIKLNNIEEKLKPLMKDNRIKFSNEFLTQQSKINNEEKKLISIVTTVKTEIKNTITDGNISNDTIQLLLKSTINNDNKSTKEKLNSKNVITSTEYGTKGFESFVLLLVNLDKQNKVDIILLAITCLLSILVEIIGLTLGVIHPVINTVYGLSNVNDINIKKSNVLTEKISKLIELFTNYVQNKKIGLVNFENKESYVSGVDSSIEKNIPICNDSIAGREIDVIEKIKNDEKESYTLGDCLLKRKQLNLQEEIKLKDLTCYILEKYGVELNTRVLGKQLKELGIEPIKRPKNIPVYFI